MNHSRIRKLRSEHLEFKLRIRTCLALLFYLGIAIDLGNVYQKVKNTTRVTPLIIVPGDELDEVLV